MSEKSRISPLKKGQIVFKIIQGGGTRTGTIQRVKAVKGGVAFLGDGREPDDVSAYDAFSGEAKENYIPGFRSFLVPLDEGEEARIKTESIR